jgi:hypothetical protein
MVNDGVRNDDREAKSNESAGDKSSKHQRGITSRMRLTRQSSMAAEVPLPSSKPSCSHSASPL